MKIKNVFILMVLTLSTIILTSAFKIKVVESESVESVYLSEVGKGPVSPTSLKMYELIEKYSDKYNIPKHIAYNVSYKETRYKGPFDWKYNPAQESNAGAVGPMQVMLATANYINDDRTDKNSLKTDLKLNIETSMKLLRRLHDKYGRWDLVCGAYNTGRPMVNDYAKYCVTNKDYRNKWVQVKI